LGLNLEQKQTVVAEVAKQVAGAQAIVLAENRGMAVAAMTQLRARARASGVYFRVVKNTLVRRAVADTPFASLADKMVGPLAYGIVCLLEIHRDHADRVAGGDRRVGQGLDEVEGETAHRVLIQAMHLDAKAEEEFHAALSWMRLASWMAATGWVALHWATTSRAQLSHCPHWVATPSSNWMSSKSIPARAWLAISRSDTRRQTQTIMAELALAGG
jgi:hypothetical protein